MTFSSEFDDATRVLVHRATAPVTADAIEKCAIEWHARLAGKTFHALWDLRAQRLDIELDELTFGHKGHIDWVHKHRQGQRHAYLVDSRMAMYLARPLKRRVHVEWDVFDDESLALHWLRTGDPQFRVPADPLAFEDASPKA